MHKIFQLDDRFATGEPTIQLVLTGNGRGGRILEKRAFDSAAASPAYEYLKDVTPKDGHSIVLVNALGAYETYDDNRNGDAFPERPVHPGDAAKCGHKECQASAWISEDEVLSKHYLTFEKHGGIYKHHVNKDPSKSLGTVRKAFWNNKMQRVELLLEIVNDRDADLAKKIADGEYPAVSMGCHVKYDVCSICGHRAPTRKEYCEHARMKMRQVMPNGEKVCVHNPSPRFFDISFVYRPADPTGFMLKKVASHGAAWEGFSAKAGELVDTYEQKIADEKKLSDIRKQLLGQVAAARTDKNIAKYRETAKQNAKGRKPADDKDIAKLARYPLSVIASTFAAKNAALSTGDVARIFLKRAGMSAPEWAIDRVVAMQPILEEVFARDPSLRDKTAGLIELRDAYVRPELFPMVDAWVEKHAGLSDYLQDKIFGPSEFMGDLPFGPGAFYRATSPAKTDLLTMTDPNTGHVYRTTRGAAQEAHNKNMAHKLFGAALLSGGYYAGLNQLIGRSLGPSWLKGLAQVASIPASIFAGTKTYELGRDALDPYRNPEYVTDQGIRVPGSTEFVKMSALKAPTYLDKVAFDVIERVGARQDPLGALRAKISAHDSRSAIARFLNSSNSDSEKAAALCSGIEYDSGELRPNEVDLDALGERVGALLLS
jgi:hypothetical protein